MGESKELGYKTAKEPRGEGLKMNVSREGVGYITAKESRGEGLKSERQQREG
jgi:hypothetical protein